MNIYIDESGSINNHNSHTPYFIIALVKVSSPEKMKLAFRRYISSNYKDLYNHSKSPEKMFRNGKFLELKGNALTAIQKRKFVDFFLRKPWFELYYIKLNNDKLSDSFCENSARAFNYSVLHALDYFYKNGFLPDEPCNLQLDERNEKTETKYFLETYLNTHLRLNGTVSTDFSVRYFDSANNCLIQIADVFANFYYSQLQTDAYDAEFKKLKESGVLKYIYEFPLH